MKKAFRLILNVTLLLALASCRPNQTNRYKIGLSQCNDDLWHLVLSSEMERELTFYPEIELLIKTSVYDTPQQIKDIDDLLEEGVDLLVVAPNEPSLLNKKIEEVISRGIPVIVVDKKISENNYTAYVGVDNYQLAYELGKHAIELLKGHGNIVIVRGQEESTNDIERCNGFMDAIGSFENIHVIDEVYGDFVRAKARDVMSESLQKHEKIDLIFAMNDKMAVGVDDAFITLRPHESPHILGVGALFGEDGGIAYIIKGVIDASAVNPAGGEQVIQVAYHILTGQPYEKNNVLPTYIVDRSNADILKIRNEHLGKQYNKFDRIKRELTRSADQLATQRVLIYTFAAVFFLVAIIAILLFWAYRVKRRSNKLLNEQKEQLILLSKQLQEATDIKLKFFTNISHEFKTPLSLIIGPIDALATSNNLNEKERGLLMLTQRNSRRLLKLLTQLIKFGGLDNNTIKVDFEWCNPVEFTESFVELFSEAKELKRIRLNIINEVVIHRTAFDKDKVEIIFFNLLANAFEYANIEGEVTIKIYNDQSNGKDFFVLSVTNTGSYIPQELHEKIFERFFTENADRGGTGIGLALVKAMIDLHHGMVKIDSDLESGTTFTVWLPVEQPGTNEKSKESEDEKSDYSSFIPSEVVKQNINRLEPILSDKALRSESTILIVDDNLDMCRYIQYILEPYYHIIRAKDGCEGLELAKKHIPDLIISDVMMPVKNGFELCEELHSELITSHIPIILLTAYSQEEQKIKGFEVGADAYISKPFSAELLKTRVKTMIESRAKLRKAFGNSIIDDSKIATLGDLEQSFIQEFKSCVETHISDASLSVDHVAEMLTMSRVQLYRKLKSTTGYSPNELIRIIRLKRARQLLSTRGMTVAEVAYQCGFSSPSYFTKCFKEFHKSSPADFLK